jgi:hypothetical protein
VTPAGAITPQDPYRTAAIETPTQNWVSELIHDLRQPLSAIEAIAYYLQMRSTDDQPHIRQCALRLQELVDDAASRLTCALRHEQSNR